MLHDKEKMRRDASGMYDSMLPEQLTSEDVVHSDTQGRMFQARKLLLGEVARMGRPPPSREEVVDGRYGH